MASSGNFCTLNPLAALGGGTPDFGTLSNGNTTVALGDTAFGNIGVTSGKWYWEFVIISSSPTGQAVGWANEQVNSGAELGYNSPSSATGAQIVYMYCDKNPPEIISDAPKSVSNGTDVDLGQTIAQYDIVGIAADFDNDKWYMSIDGSFTDMRSGQNPADGSNPLCSKTGEGGLVTIARTAGYVWYPAVGNWAASARTFKVNFGQDSTFGGQSSLPGTNANAADGNGYGNFYYTPPTGFLALCTANLSINEDIDPAQTDSDYPAKQFNTILYTGNGSNNHAISGLGFQPDLVWIHRRSGGTSYGNGILDSCRGAGLGMYPNRADADTTFTSDFDSFDSDGFTVDAGSSMNINNSSSPFVAHCWKGGGAPTADNSESAGATPTAGSVKIDGSNLGSALAGSIAATKISANTKGGFSTILYTGTGSNATIGHGLSAKPDFFMVKDRGRSGESWNVYHSSLGATKYLVLDTNSVANANTNRWNDTEPTTTTIGLGTNDNTNGSSPYLCYAWHNVSGMQHFGGYEGNGNADGPFCYTGFRPRMVILKDVDRTEDWVMFDSERNTYNPIDKGLFCNSSAAETTGSGSGFDIDFLSNGFKLRCTHDNMNGSSTYVYACWGDVPFKYNNTF